MIDLYAVIELYAFSVQGTQYVSERVVTDMEVARNSDYFKEAPQSTALAILQLLLNAFEDFPSGRVLLFPRLNRQRFACA